MLVVVLLFFFLREGACFGVDCDEKVAFIYLSFSFFDRVVYFVFFFLT